VSAVKTNVAWMYSRNRDKWHSWWGAIAPLELGRLRGTGGNRRHRRCILRLYSDLNTPAAADGALDWMALGHMLGVEGCEPALAETTGHGPLLEPSQVVLVAHSLSHSTRLSGVRSNDYGWPGLPGRMSGGIPKMARGERSS
jgi:hypothetical protein